MDNWKKIKVGKFIEFNPKESLKLGSVARKVAMEKLGTFDKKIKGWELTEYKGGPKFKNGDTLFARITPCLENGKTARVDVLKKGEVAFGSTEFIVLRENELSDGDFVYYLATSPTFRRKAISCMEGTSGRKRVNEKALQEQIISAPDLPTQRKIAAVLSSLDAKIELNRRINAELEALAKTLYDYWFVQFDFPDAQGKPYKSSGGKMVWSEALKREVPEGWEVVELNSKVNIDSGYPFDSNDYVKNGSYKVITIKNVQEEGLDTSIVDYISNLSSKIPAFCILKLGDVLMSLTGNVGRICHVTENYTVLNQRVGKINCNTSLINFAYLFFKRPEERKRLELIATGSSQKNLSPVDASNRVICFPVETILFQFNKIVNPVFETKIKNDIEIQRLTALRDWLLPLLMNGQVRVG